MTGTCSFVCCNCMRMGHSSRIATTRFASRCTGRTNCCHWRATTIGFGKTANRFTWKWTRTSWWFESLINIRIWVQYNPAIKHLTEQNVCWEKKWNETNFEFLHRYYHHYYPYRPYYGYYGYPYGYYGECPFLPSSFPGGAAVCDYLINVSYHLILYRWFFSIWHFFRTSILPPILLPILLLLNDETPESTTNHLQRPSLRNTHTHNSIHAHALISSFEFQFWWFFSPLRLDRWKIFKFFHWIIFCDFFFWLFCFTFWIKSVCKIQMDFVFIFIFISDSVETEHSAKKWTFPREPESILISF